MCILGAVRCKGRLEKKTEILLRLHLEQCGTSKRVQKYKMTGLVLHLEKIPLTAEWRVIK